MNMIFLFLISWSANELPKVSPQVCFGDHHPECYSLSSSRQKLTNKSLDEVKSIVKVIRSNKFKKGLHAQPCNSRVVYIEKHTTPICLEMLTSNEQKTFLQLQKALKNAR